MPSRSDMMLARGCVAHLGAVHGEPITVTSGTDAGLVFQSNIIETAEDFSLATDLGNDPRAKRLIRFSCVPLPRLSPQDIIQTADGKRWHAVREPGVAYLTTDYELHEIAPRDT